MPSLLLASGVYACCPPVEERILPRAFPEARRQRSRSRCRRPPLPPWGGGGGAGGNGGGFMGGSGTSAEMGSFANGGIAILFGKK